MFKKLFTLLGLILSLFSLFSQIVNASTDVVTNCNDSGPGSLRQVIGNATSGDTIVFALNPSCSLITLTSGEIDIPVNLTIQGPGANALAISGNNASRIFNIYSQGYTVSVNISGLTIENGNSGSQDGGGILMAGGDTVNITNCIINNNVAGARGGGLFNNDAFLTIAGSIFSNNQGGSGGGGLWSPANGSTQISNSTFSDNSNGAINISGYGQISNTTFSGNGSYAINDDSYNGLTLDDDSIYGTSGDALYVNSNGNVVVSNTTIANNSGAYTVANAGVLQFTNNTLSNNRATYSTLYNDGQLTLGSSIISGTSGGGVDCTYIMPITDQGYNLADDNTCPLSSASPYDDLVGANPQLGQLEDNGGPTYTMAINSTSPEFRYVNSSNYCPSSDQRGYSRPFPCSIGAFDLGTVTSLGTSLNPSVYSQPVTFTAYLTQDDGGGSVIFSSNGSVIPGCSNQPLSLTNNAYQATCTTSSINVGTDNIMAQYSGDNVYAGSTGSLAGGQVVQKAETTMYANPVSATSVSLIAKLTANWSGVGIAGLAVNFSSGSTGLCQNVITDSSGDATCTISATQLTAILTNGGYQAVFNGDSNYYGSSANGSVN